LGIGGRLRRFAARGVDNSGIEQLETIGIQSQECIIAAREMHLAHGRFGAIKQGSVFLINVERGMGRIIGNCPYHRRASRDYSPTRVLRIQVRLQTRTQSGSERMIGLDDVDLRLTARYTTRYCISVIRAVSFSEV